MTVLSVPLVLTLAFLMGSVPAGLQAQADPSSYDLVIRGGRVVDGDRRVPIAVIQLGPSFFVFP